MFDIATIQSIAVGGSDSLVAWEQPTLTGSVAVAAALKTGRSGLTFQKGSNIVRVSNIQNTIEDNEASDAEVNAELTGITKQALIDVINSIFAEDDFIDGGLLYKYESDFEADVIVGDYFFGYEIDSCNANDLTAIISRIMLEFTGVETIDVLLFNSQKKDYITKTTITTVADDTVEEEVNLNLSNYKYGGKFYIGYLSNGLSGSPIKREFELGNLESTFNGISIRAVQVLHNAETMFDVKDIEYVSNTFGMNLDVQTYEDYTQTIKSNQRKFAKALQLQVGVNVADLIINSTRSNKDQRINKSAVLFELNGNVNNKEMPAHVGLAKKLDIELKRLKNTFNPQGIIKATLR